MDSGLDGDPLVHWLSTLEAFPKGHDDLHMPCAEDSLRSERCFVGQERWRGSFLLGASIGLLLTASNLPFSHHYF